MQLVVTTRGNVRTLKIPDDITFSNASTFHKALTEQAVDLSFTHVVVDLRGVNFINSSAIGSLVWLHNQMATRKGKVVLVRVSVDIKRLFTKTRLDEKFWIRDDIDEALKELSEIEA